MTARPDATLDADERADIEAAHKILSRLCEEGVLCMSIPVRNTDEDMILSRVIARAALAAPAVVVSAEPVVFALLWDEDPRLNLSTMFDTELEAKEYAEKCLSSAEIVPLYTRPATPVGPDAVDADPLQGAANWLIESLHKCDVGDLQSSLLIGYNRAKRLHDAALASTKPSKGAA